jgi:hypothetical protein
MNKEKRNVYRWENQREKDQDVGGWIILGSILER